MLEIYFCFRDYLQKVRLDLVQLFFQIASCEFFRYLKHEYGQNHRLGRRMEEREHILSLAGGEPQAVKQSGHFAWRL